MLISKWFDFSQNQRQEVSFLSVKTLDKYPFHLLKITQILLVWDLSGASVLGLLYMHLYVASRFIWYFELLIILVCCVCGAVIQVPSKLVPQGVEYFSGNETALVIVFFTIWFTFHIENSNFHDRAPLWTCKCHLNNGRPYEARVLCSFTWLQLVNLSVNKIMIMIEHCVAEWNSYPEKTLNLSHFRNCS